MILKSLEIVKSLIAPAGFEIMAFRFVVNALTVFTKKTPHKITLDFIVYYEMKYVTI